MPMSWKSLELLKQNLGGIGEGVKNYLDARQEDTRRQQEYEQLRQFQQSPTGGQIDQGLYPLAFSGAGYKAGPAMESLIKTQESLTPKVDVVHDPKLGMEAVRVNKLTGDVTHQNIVPPPAQSLHDQVGALPDNALYSISLTPGHPLQQHAKDVLAAKARDVRTRQEFGSGLAEQRAKETAERAGEARASIDLGNQMTKLSDEQKKVKALLDQIPAGQESVGFGVNPGDKIVRSVEQGKLDALKAEWERVRQQLNDIKHKYGEHSDERGVMVPYKPYGKPTSQNTLKTPSGVPYTIETA
jgi:hypothetical protein